VFIKKEETCIQNVVASATLSQPMNLEAIVKAFLQVEYRPKVFLGLAFRLKKPRTCSLIFRTGRMVCTVAKSEGEARRAIFKVAKELRAADIITLGKPVIKIQNIVASGSIGSPVDLGGLCQRLRLGGSIMYEPEQIPGAIYRIKSPSVVFLIF
jgi:transcription initiation factor TFIID TATA-box-binding protein